MRTKHITSLLLGLLFTAGTLFAQKDRGQLWDLQQIQVTPSKVAAFEKSAMNIVKLAETHAVSADYGWHFWSDGFDYYIASPMANFAAQDDPDAWMRQFGEEGGKKLGEIFQGMDTEVMMRPQSREILEELNDWAYSPATAGELTAGTLYSFYIKPGHAEQFGKVVNGFQEFWKAVDYPYSVMAYRIHFGSVDRVEFMIFHDGVVNFLGDNSGATLAKKAGKEEMHQKLLGEITQHIDDMEMKHMAYRPELSYDGPENTADNR